MARRAKQSGGNDRSPALRPHWHHRTHCGRGMQQASDRNTVCSSAHVQPGQRGRSHNARLKSAYCTQQKISATAQAFNWTSPLPNSPATLFFSHCTTSTNSVEFTCGSACERNSKMDVELCNTKWHCSTCSVWVRRPMYSRTLVTCCTGCNVTAAV